MKVSFVIPVVNNFKYTKYVYDNLRKYYPNDEIVSLHRDLALPCDLTPEDIGPFNSLDGKSLLLRSLSHRLVLAL